MVGVAIQCRIGNQLFQYAFIKSLSEKFNTPFFIKETTEKFTAAEYFDFEGYSPTGSWINWLVFKLKTRNFLKTLQSTAIDNYGEATNDKIYSGYFQSDQYFLNIADKLPTYIKVKANFKDEFDKRYRQIFAGNRVIAVHIRRGDYLNLNEWWAENFGSHDLTLPASYYRACLDKIENREAYRVIFVSDDIEFVRTAFADVEGAMFANDSMIIDFQLLMNADICILSNSSFGWWAAYLNSKAHKKIYCPEYWLGFKVKKEYPENIIPAEWTKVAV